MIRLHPEAKGVSVRTELPDEMKAWFDGTKLRRVFFNLLFNACQAHATRIENQSSRIGRSAVVRISDNGDGIPEFVRANLFQPFVTGKQNGTGVGLAIVQKCCRDHGGDVTLEATAPGQTIFRITLPLAGTESDPESEALTRTEITA
jgi:signal transduction histidine kinase